MNRHRWDVVALLSIATSVVVSALVYDRLPDPVATHFDIHGAPNGWTSRDNVVWGGPTFTLVLWVVTRFFWRLLPLRDKQRLSGAPVELVAMMTAVFLAATNLLVLHIALTPGASVMRPIVFFISAFFVGLGLVMPRLRRNPIMGFRTAWTLTSDENWARTHRVAGYAMVVSGLVGAVAGMLGGPSGFAFAISAFLVGSLAPVIYSFVIARRADPG